jgi:hypothetical protein
MYISVWWTAGIGQPDVQTSIHEGMNDEGFEVLVALGVERGCKPRERLGKSEIQRVVRHKKWSPLLNCSVDRTLLRMWFVVTHFKG